MLNDHPSAGELESFVRGAPGSRSATRNLRILRHLLADCGQCRALLDTLGWFGSRLERLISTSIDTPAESNKDSGHLSVTLSYDSAFAKAERAVDALLAEVPEPKAPIHLLLAELDHLGLEKALTLENPSRYAHPDLVLRLVDRSNSLRFSDPQSMLQDAQASLAIASRCTPDLCGSSERLADTLALAWSQLGTALRIGSQLREAEEAGEKALAFMKQGTGDPILRMGIFRQISAIHQFHRRFEQSIELLRAAGAIAREIGDSHALATALVQEAVSTTYAGDAEGAVRLINLAIPLIDQEIDPYLLLFACHNLVRCYIDLDRPEQALALLSEFRDLYHEIKDKNVSLKVAWQEGQLLRDLGHPQAAETTFLRVREGFAESGMMYEVAVVSLDLASVYIRQGRVEDVQRTLETTIPVFRSLGVERETLAALLQLQQVGGQQQRALELVRFLNSRIQPGSRDEVLK